MSIPFYDRRRELGALREALGSERPELVVIYGRRRVGKTALVKRLLDEFPGIYLYVEGPSTQRFLSKASEALGLELRTLDHFLEEVFGRSKDERFVVVLDEYQRISRLLSPKLQHYWDAYSSSVKCKIILLGSTIGMVKRDINYAGPLYGRATKALRLGGFDYAVARQLFSNLRGIEAVKIYSILGGTPHYLLTYDTSRSLEENIKKLFIEPGAPLYEEVERLLLTELREPLRYMEVLEAIAAGKFTLKEISDYIKLERSQLKKYLLKLEKLELIGREVGVLKSRVPRYYILDNFFAFYVAFINRLRDHIELGQIDYVSSEVVKSLPTYLGKAFESICLETLSKLLAGYEVGRYWDREGNEIDIVAIKDKAGIFFECKLSEPDRRDATLFKGKVEQIAKRLKLERTGLRFLTSRVRKRTVEGVRVIGLDELVKMGSASKKLLID